MQCSTHCAHDKALNYLKNNFSCKNADLHFSTPSFSSFRTSKLQTFELKETEGKQNKNFPEFPKLGHYIQ